MDKTAPKQHFFRSISVQRENVTINRYFFRSKSVHFSAKAGIFLTFPEHIRPVDAPAVIKREKKAAFFRSKPVHSFGFFRILCIVKSLHYNTYMAGKIKDMSLIKQVLQLKQLGESNRGISRKLFINKETVNNYIKTVRLNGWTYEELLGKDDPGLDRMFHAGNPAYSDPRMDYFLSRLPYYKEQLGNPKLHVTRQLLYEEYKQACPGGYSKSQFYFHLKQNLVAQKDCTAVLTETYNPGEKLMVDFAGDKLGYVDAETGETVKVEVFVACMPYSDYTYVVCVPSQKTEDFIFAIRMCLEHLGGVPPILTPDNLKSAVISNDRHEPRLNKALEDMGNHYHFVVLPCDPKRPTQKAPVEDKVKTTYNRIYAKLRNRTFHSIIELNRAVWEQLSLFNKTRMQKRPYSREERFHAMEADRLNPLPASIYEMKYYAELQVQSNCFVELRHDKTTHFYSVPYMHVGKKALVIFTRSVVNIYVDGILAASHRRSHEYGHTYVKSHLASNCRAIMERSAAYYVAWASNVSPGCREYIAEVFNPERTNRPEEVYYKLCAAIISLSRKYERALIDKTCRQCLECRVFSYRKFEAILKRNSLQEPADEPAFRFDAPTPTNHENMRGSAYFG
ncbi:IS21 family transposase [Parabacteroides sp. ZJ-118]|uniref:IS21 family transposase n=1 Tax=Parabacteroides sp. ZJ-118 TaxID=2709398 RepID=UPI001F150B22|nr:IS21 family transposase [Parabacteroides sp. ZJ-118]